MTGSKFLRLSLLLIGSVSVFACSTASVRVMPGDKGVNKVVARDIELEGAEEAAHKAANEYCEKSDRQAVFIKEKSSYKGQMDEGTRKGIRSASNALYNIPGGAMLGNVGHSATNDRDYVSAALFKCSEIK